MWRSRVQGVSHSSLSLSCHHSSTLVQQGNHQHSGDRATHQQGNSAVPMWSQHSTSAGMIKVSTSATGRMSTATGLPVSCVPSMNIEGEDDLLQHFKPKDETQK